MSNTSPDLLGYKKYLIGLANDNSSVWFTNSGKDYASILMSVLLKNTQNEVRIYCHGFKPDLITTNPYWNTLNDFVKNQDKVIHVLVQTDEFLNCAPLNLLKTEKQNRIQKQKALKTNELKDANPLMPQEEIDKEIANMNCDSIIVKKILDADKEKITNQFGLECNFAVFDNEKFRFEIDPNKFIAFGSFNQKDYCTTLIGIFDEAFNTAKVLF